MKIAKTLLVTVAAAALSFGGATSAFAASGNGDAGTNSHYPPQSAQTGCGDAGTNSHYPPSVCSVVVKQPKATGHVARLTTVFNDAGKAVKVRMVFDHVHASKITVKAKSCDGAVLSKGSRSTPPSAADHLSYEFAGRAPEGAGRIVVKFSQPGKQATVQRFQLSSCK